MQPKSFIFKGFDLQAYPYKTVQATNLYDAPKVDNTSFELARSDGSVTVASRYASKNFTLSGNIQVTTTADLEGAIDALKLALLNQTGDVVASWGAGFRYFTAKCLNVLITRGQADATRCTWSAQFLMDQPFSTDNITRDLITAVTGNTAGSLTVSTSNFGTHPANPLILLTLTDINPNNADVTITIGNPATNDTMSFTSRFADGDVITMDTLKKQIFKNSTLLPGIGNFPSWAPGSGLLTYSDTGASRTISMTAQYIARFI